MIIWNPNLTVHPGFATTLEAEGGEASGGPHHFAGLRSGKGMAEAEWG